MPRRSPAPDHVSPYRRLPVWAQWAIPFAIAIAAVAVIVAFVNAHQGQDGAEAGVNAAQLKIEEQQADIEMRQQQAPHTARATVDAKPADALAQAVRTWMKRQVDKGRMGGPVSSVSCSPAPGPADSAQWITMKCVVKAAQVSYDFRGVVQPRLGKLTYCQRVGYAPQYGAKLVPLSPACL